MSSISAQKSISNLKSGHSYLHMKTGQCNLNQCSRLHEIDGFLSFIISVFSGVCLLAAVLTGHEIMRMEAARVSVDRDIYKCCAHWL